jgi:4-hydroxybenzoate polyprenyltransferase
MNFALAFIRLLRLPNLGIVFLTQYLPYWFGLRPAILRAGGIPVLTERTFGLIAGATVLTTLGGYVLNDYYDRDMDAINKPRRVVWGARLPASFALTFYAGIVVAAHYLAFLIDSELRPHNHWPLWLYPGVSFFLFLYAWQLKCTAVMGNFLVSLLCALVPVVVLFPEERPLWLASFIQPDLIQQATGLVWLYALFSFITNLLREQIKDLEDFQGDAACGCATLAVLKGPRFAKKPAGFTGIIVCVLTVFLLFFWHQTGAPEWQVVAGVLLLLLPALFATAAIYRAQRKADFTRVSALVKIVMFTGVFLLLRSWPQDFGEIFASLQHWVAASR